MLQFDENALLSKQSLRKGMPILTKRDRYDSGEEGNHHSHTLDRHKKDSYFEIIFLGAILKRCDNRLL